MSSNKEMVDTNRAIQVQGVLPEFPVNTTMIGLELTGHHQRLN